jgi:hypothetical protein
MTALLPQLGETTILEFVMERFLIEMFRRIQSVLDERLVIAFVTSSEYFDEDRKRFVCDPPEVKVIRGVARASVPAISLGQFTWTRNRDLYAERFEFLPKRFVACDNQMVDGFSKRNPIEILAVNVRARLFDEKPQKLLRLQRLLMQYLRLHPYLFIPVDFEDRQAITDDCVLEQLKKEWFADPFEGLSVPGFFVKQIIPINQVVFTSTLTPSIDNLFVAETNIMIEDVPVPDGLDLGDVPPIRSGNLELLRAIDIPIFGVDCGDKFEDREDEIHSRVTLGTFKECE